MCVCVCVCVCAGVHAVVCMFGGDRAEFYIYFLFYFIFLICSGFCHTLK